MKGKDDLSNREGRGHCGRRTSKAKAQKISLSSGERGHKGREANHSQAPVGVGIHLLSLGCHLTSQGGGRSSCVHSSCVHSSDIAGERSCLGEEGSGFICVLGTTFCKDMLGANHQEPTLASGQLSKTWSSNLGHIVPSSSLPVQTNVTSSVKPSQKYTPPTPPSPSLPSFHPSQWAGTSLQAEQG